MMIRSIVICLIENEGKIFVGEGHDDIKSETYYRPLGGGIEFGELAAETAVREFKEEMNTDIEVTSYLHTFENIFTFNGNKGHEIALLVSAKFINKSFYEKDEITCNEEGIDFIAKWVDKNEFIKNEKILYPVGLSKYLEET